MIKTCTKCKRTLEANSENFFKQKPGVYGYESQCKACVKARRRGRYKPVIYKITNVASGNVYIGKTIKPISERFSHHVNRAKNGNKSWLYRDIREFGRDSFTVEVIEYVTSESILNEREVYWINVFREDMPDKIYNLEGGGDSGYTVHEISKKRMSRSKGLKDSIYVYDWVKNEEIGVFDTITEASEYLEIPMLSNLSVDLNNEKFSVRKSHLFLYEKDKVRLEHFLKTTQENMVLSSKNNGFAYDKNKRSLTSRGGSNAMAKVDEVTAMSIIKDLIDGVRNKDISEKYNVSKKLISSINNRRTWKHITIEGYEDVDCYNRVKKKRGTC